MSKDLNSTNPQA